MNLFFVHKKKHSRSISNSLPPLSSIDNAKIIHLFFALPTYCKVLQSSSKPRAVKSSLIHCRGAAELKGRKPLKFF